MKEKKNNDTLSCDLVVAENANKNYTRSKQIAIESFCERFSKGQRSCAFEKSDHFLSRSKI